MNQSCWMLFVQATLALTNSDKSSRLKQTPWLDNCAICLSKAIPKTASICICFSQTVNAISLLRQVIMPWFPLNLLQLRLKRVVSNADLPTPLPGARVISLQRVNVLNLTYGALLSYCSPASCPETVTRVIKCTTHYVLSFAQALLSALLTCWINYLHHRYLTKQCTSIMLCQISASVRWWIGTLSHFSSWCRLPPME